MRLRKPRPRVLLAAAAVTGSAFLAPAAAAQATSYVPLNGSGSSWAGPAIDQWSHDVQPDGITINFSPTGSAAGREAFIEDQADFAASDIAFLTQPDPFGGGTEQVAEAYSYIPIVAGGTSFMYNLKVGGRKITNLRLSGSTIVKIFTGQITNWDAPQITHDYGQQLPSQPITVVTRSDGSGASYQFTRWMSKEYTAQWNTFCTASGGPSGNCGPTEFFPGNHPGFKEENGSDQVASYILSYEGSIGYDEYSYARSDSIPVVKLLNKAGYYTLPTQWNVAIALEKAQIDENPADLTFLMQDLDNVYTDPDPRAYPLSSYSYLVVPRDSRTISGTKYGPPKEFSTAKGVTLSTWLNYVLCGAQQSAGNLGYSPLPKNLVVGGFQQDEQIPGHVATPNLSQLNNCDNPTYHNGIDYLTKDAPQPSPCDYVTAPLNCVVQGGKARAAAGPGGITGSAQQTPGANGTAGPGKGGSATGAGQQINPNTGQVEGGPAGYPGTQVNAEPVSLVGRPPGEWALATLTALELLAAIAVPTVLGTWLQRRRVRRSSGP